MRLANTCLPTVKMFPQAAMVYQDFTKYLTSPIAPGLMLEACFNPVPYCLQLSTTRAELSINKCMQNSSMSCLKFNSQGKIEAAIIRSLDMSGC